MNTYMSVCVPHFLHSMVASHLQSSAEVCHGAAPTTGPLALLEVPDAGDAGQEATGAMVLKRYIYIVSGIEYMVYGI